MEARLAAFEAEKRLILDGFSERVRPISKVAAPRGKLVDGCAVYPVGDYHTGQLSWAIETRGASYDLRVARKLLVSAMSHLITKLPKCGTAFIPFMGDFIHFDGFRAETPQHKHLLDADSRFPKVARTAIQIARAAIDTALQHHHEVHVVWELGNHDPTGAIWMMELLACVYEKNPRVHIDTHPGKFHYFEFGRNLIQTHHGDMRIKPEKLPLIMALDQAEAWGRTEHRWTLLGHHHHESRVDGGTVIEVVPVLTPNDAYAANSGYRAKRQMQAVLLDPKYGEEERHTFNATRFVL